MKRTVMAKDECAAAEPEAKRARTDEADEAETVLELDEHQFECVVCFDLLVDPVVGKCGHDFCKACLEDWARRQHTHGRTTCPVCRKDVGLNRPTHFGGPSDELGVCIRLKGLVERLFPRRSKQRRNEVEEEEQVRKQRHEEEQQERRTADAAHAANMQQMLQGLRQQQHGMLGAGQRHLSSLRQQLQRDNTLFGEGQRHLSSLRQQMHRDNALLQRAATELESLSSALFQQHPGGAAAAAAGGGGGGGGNPGEDVDAAAPNAEAAAARALRRRAVPAGALFGDVATLRERAQLRMRAGMLLESPVLFGAGPAGSFGYAAPGYVVDPPPVLQPGRGAGSSAGAAAAVAAERVGDGHPQQQQRCVAADLRGGRWDGSQRLRHMRAARRGFGLGAQAGAAAAPPPPPPAVAATAGAAAGPPAIPAELAAHIIAGADADMVATTTTSTAVATAVQAAEAQAAAAEAAAAQATAAARRAIRAGGNAAAELAMAMERAAAERVQSGPAAAAAGSAGAAPAAPAAAAAAAGEAPAADAALQRPASPQLEDIRFFDDLADFDWDFGSQTSLPPTADMLPRLSDMTAGTPSAADDDGIFRRPPDFMRLEGLWGRETLPGSAPALAAAAAPAAAVTAVSGEAAVPGVAAPAAAAAAAPVAAAEDVKAEQNGMFQGANQTLSQAAARAAAMRGSRQAAAAGGAAADRDAVERRLQWLRRVHNPLDVQQQGRAGAAAVRSAARSAFAVGARASDAALGLVQPGEDAPAAAAQARRGAGAGQLLRSDWDLIDDVDVYGHLSQRRMQPQAAAAPAAAPAPAPAAPATADDLARLEASAGPAAAAAGVAAGAAGGAARVVEQSRALVAAAAAQQQRQQQRLAAARLRSGPGAALAVDPGAPGAQGDAEYDALADTAGSSRALLGAVAAADAAAAGADVQGLPRTMHGMLAARFPSFTRLQLQQRMLRRQQEEEVRQLQLRQQKQQQELFQQMDAAAAAHMQPQASAVAECPPPLAAAAAAAGDAHAGEARSGCGGDERHILPPGAPAPAAAAAAASGDNELVGSPAASATPTDSMGGTATEPSVFFGGSDGSDPFDTNSMPEDEEEETDTHSGDSGAVSGAAGATGAAAGVAQTARPALSEEVVGRPAQVQPAQQGGPFSQQPAPGNNLLLAHAMRAQALHRAGAAAAAGPAGPAAAPAAAAAGGVGSALLGQRLGMHGSSLVRVPVAPWGLAHMPHDHMPYHASLEEAPVRGGVVYDVTRSGPAAAAARSGGGSAYLGSGAAAAAAAAGSGMREGVAVAPVLHAEAADGRAAAAAAVPGVAAGVTAQRATSASAELADEVARVTARRVRREMQHLMGALLHAPAPTPEVVDGGYISSDTGDA